MRDPPLRYDYSGCLEMLLPLLCLRDVYHNKIAVGGICGCGAATSWQLETLCIYYDCSLEEQ